MAFFVLLSFGSAKKHQVERNESRQPRSAGLVLLPSPFLVDLHLLGTNGRQHAWSITFSLFFTFCWAHFFASSKGFGLSSACLFFFILLTASIAQSLPLIHSLFFSVLLSFVFYFFFLLTQRSSAEQLQPDHEGSYPFSSIHSSSISTFTPLTFLASPVSVAAVTAGLSSSSLHSSLFASSSSASASCAVGLALPSSSASLSSSSTASSSPSVVVVGVAPLSSAQFISPLSVSVGGQG